VGYYRLHFKLIKVKNILISDDINFLFRQNTPHSKKKLNVFQNNQQQTKNNQTRGIRKTNKKQARKNCILHIFLFFNTYKNQ